MSKNPIKVMSSVTGRIYAGRVNPKNQMFVGEKDDVTDTAVSAVAEHLLKEEICLQFEVKGKTYRLEVVEVKRTANDMGEITIRCTNCGLEFESDYDLEQNLIDPETGEIHDGCPTCKTDAYLMDLIKYPDLEPANDL